MTEINITRYGDIVSGDNVITGTVSVPAVGAWDPIGDIVEFHLKFGLEYEGKPRALPRELGEFRYKFMREEVEEYGDCGVDLERELNSGNPEDAEVNGFLEGQLDAIIDAVYITIGTAYLHGFNRHILVEAWRRVHAKNMAKVRAERADQSTRGSTFDVVKPAGWTPPSHTDLIEDNIHRTKRPDLGTRLAIASREAGAYARGEPNECVVVTTDDIGDVSQVLGELTVRGHTATEHAEREASGKSVSGNVVVPSATKLTQTLNVVSEAVHNTRHMKKNSNEG